MTARFPLTAIVAIGAGALLSSCAYDPYAYGSPSVSTSVGYSNVGHGHVSSSIFISTGNSRWGYDPYCRSYYDYTTRCYYDPWLRGYYPRGYRPPVVVGLPHPHGWHSGMKTCPPPSQYRNYKLANYQNRHLAYRNLDHSWAKHVRPGSNSTHTTRPTTGPHNHRHQVGTTPNRTNPGWGHSGNQNNNRFMGRTTPPQNGHQTRPGENNGRNWSHSPSSNRGNTRSTPPSSGHTTHPSGHNNGRTWVQAPSNNRAGNPDGNRGYHGQSSASRGNSAVRTPTAGRTSNTTATTPARIRQDTRSHNAGSQANAERMAQFQAKINEFQNRQRSEMDRRFNR